MIEINHVGPNAPYEQIRQQLADRITAGTLTVGTRLPTVRQLAADLGLAQNTVARAYRELEVAGLIQTRGRAGTFVHTTDIARAQAEAGARAYVQIIQSTNLSLDDAIELLKAAANRASASA